MVLGQGGPNWSDQGLRKPNGICGCNLLRLIPIQSPWKAYTFNLVFAVFPEAKQKLDFRFKVFKMECGRAVIFHYSLWLKSLINTIMKILWIFENPCGANCHIMKFCGTCKKHAGGNGNLMIQLCLAWLKNCSGYRLSKIRPLFGDFLFHQKFQKAGAGGRLITIIHYFTSSQN